MTVYSGWRDGVVDDHARQGQDKRMLTRDPVSCSSGKVNFRCNEFCQYGKPHRLYGQTVSWACGSIRELMVEMAVLLAESRGPSVAAGEFAGVVVCRW